MTSPFVSGVTNVTLFGDTYGDLNVTVDAANTSLSFPAGFPKTAATGAVMEAQLRCQYFYYFLINSLGAGMFCLVGFVGNALSCAVLSRDRNTSPVAFTWFYVRVYSHPLTFVSQTATIWLTVLIAASRHVAVCMPYRASVYCNLSITRKGVAAVAIFSLFYNLPRFFEFVIETEVRRNYTRPKMLRTALGQSSDYQKIYFDALYYVFSFVLPLALLALFNTRLILAYRIVQRRRAVMRIRSRAGSESHEQNITLVMIVVIVVFMICNAPARVVQIIWSYESQPCPSTAFFLMTMSNVLEVFSSSTNFFIYCAFRKQFRQILVHRFRCALCCCTNCAEQMMLDGDVTETGVRGRAGRASVAPGGEMSVDQGTTDVALHDGVTGSRTTRCQELNNFIDENHKERTAL